MRGRPPTDTGVKLLQGTHRPDRDGECQAEVGAPDAPEWLCDEAKEEWGRVVDELVLMGVLSKIDRSALTSYCIAWGNLQQATRAIDADGLTIETPDGIVRHPLLKVQQDAMNTIRHFGGLFGLNPLYRQRMKASVPPPPDEFEQLFGQ